MRTPPRASWLAAIPLVLFWRAVFLGEVFYHRDIHLIWFGQVETFVRAVASGSWPVWDPFTAFGQPLLANPDAQVLYPLTWLNLLMRPGTYYTFFAVAHLVFSGLGFHLLARRLGCSPGGALLGASVWMASGPLLSTVNVWHHYASAAWAPWVFAAADRAVASLRLRDAVLCGAALAAQVLAGSADMTMIFGLVLVPFVLVRRDRDAPFGSWPRLAVLGVTAAATALALSAALWLPTLDVVSRSARADLPADIRTNWSVHPWNLVQTLVPVPLHALPLHPRWREALFDSREPFLASLYLGAVALPFVLAALAGRSSRSLRILGVSSLAAAILFAVGKHGAFYALATGLIPPLRILRYPSKAMVVAAFAWALLAALGYDEWRRPLAGSRRRWLIAVGGPALLLVAGVFSAAVLVRYAAPAVGGRLFDPQIPAHAFASILAPSLHRLLVCGALGAAAAFLVWRRARDASSWPAVAVAALAVLDLALAHITLNRTAPEKLLAYRPPTLDWIVPQDFSRLYVYDYFGVRGSERYLRPVRIEDEQRKLKEAWPFAFPEVIAYRTYLQPPVGTLFRLFGSYDVDMRGLEPRPLARLSVFLRAVEGSPAHLRLLRMGAISRVIARHSEGLEDLTPLATLDGLMGPLHVYGVPDPLPRAYAVSGARIADGQAAFDALVQPFDPGREVILPSGRPSLPSPSFSGTARVTALEADRVRVEAELSEAGYVVLVDAYDPGWRTSVDGRPAELLRANLAFRAVAVPAGRHVIESVYRPRAVLAGLAISAAALAAVLAVALRAGLVAGSRVR